MHLYQWQTHTGRRGNDDTAALNICEISVQEEAWGTQGGVSCWCRFFSLTHLGRQCRIFWQKNWLCMVCLSILMVVSTRLDTHIPYPTEKNLRWPLSTGATKGITGIKGGEVLLLLRLLKDVKSHVHLFEKSKGHSFLPSVLSIPTLKEQ